MNQKGITIIGLIITIVIIATIAGVCIYTGRDLLEEAKLEQLKTNMLLIQAKCQSIGEKVTAKELTESDYIGTKITSTITINDYTVSVLSEDKWYGLTVEDIKDKVGLGNINVEQNDYLVNYLDGEVVYTKGYNGKYTLTEIKDL